MERYAPEALEGFRALARTGCVEFLGETSHHSLAFLGDASEFRSQVESQRTRAPDSSRQESETGGARRRRSGSVSSLGVA